MPLSLNEIESLIQECLPGANVQVRELEGDPAHFSAYVTSDLFEGKTRIEQHQMVYDALKDKLKSGIASLALQTATPGERLTTE